MALTARGQVGPQVLQDGVEEAVRQGKAAELIVSELHGKYYEQSYRGNLFTATTPVAALLAAAATSMAPLSLWNPQNSGINLVLIRTIIALAALPGTQVAGAFAYYVSQNVATPTVTTRVTELPSQIGKSTRSTGQALSAGTLAAAPTLYLPVAGKVGVTGGPSGALRIIDEPDGAIIVSPGCSLTVQESVADTTSNYTAMLGFIWEEVPV